VQSTQAESRLVAIRHQDNRRRLEDGRLLGGRFGRDAGRLRRGTIGAAASGRGLRCLIRGGRDNLILCAGLAVPFARGGRISGYGGEGRDNKKLLHDRAPLDKQACITRSGRAAKCRSPITKP